MVRYICKTTTEDSCPALRMPVVKSTPFATSNMLELSVWRSGMTLNDDGWSEKMRCSRFRSCCWKNNSELLRIEDYCWNSYSVEGVEQVKRTNNFISTSLFEPSEAYMIRGIFIYNIVYIDILPILCKLRQRGPWWMQHQRPAIGPATSFILKRQRHQRSTAHQKVPLPVAKSRTAFVKTLHTGGKLTIVGMSLIVFFIHTNGIWAYSKGN